MDQDILSFLFVVKKDVGAPMGFTFEYLYTEMEALKVTYVGEGYISSKNKWLASVEENPCVQERTLRSGDFITCVNGETDPTRMASIFQNRGEKNYFIRVERHPERCDGDAAGGWVKQDTPSSPSRMPQAPPAVGDTAQLPSPMVGHSIPSHLVDAGTGGSEAMCHLQHHPAQPQFTFGAPAAPQEMSMYQAVPPPPPPKQAQPRTVGTGEAPAPSTAPPIWPSAAAPAQPAPQAQQLASQHKELPTQQQQDQAAQQVVNEGSGESHGEVMWRDHFADCNYTSEGEGYVGVARGAGVQVAYRSGVPIRERGDPKRGDKYAVYIYVHCGARRVQGWAPEELLGTRS